MLTFRSKRAYLVAMVCLAFMVVALGTAAKHSQFEGPAHSTHYLKQSIKMVACSHHVDAVAVPSESQTALSFVAPVPAAALLTPLVVFTSVPTPLLI